MVKELISGGVAALLLCTPFTSLGKSHVATHIDSLVNTTKIVDIEASGSEPRVKKLREPELTPDLDSLRNLVLAFYFDQFRHSQDPEAPNFLFMSKSANMLMGIGGVVRMRAWEDFGGAVPGNGFMPYLIPIPKNPAEPSKFGTTPSGTALFFQMVGRMSKFTYRLYIECNFNGYQGRGFHLKKAFATVGDFTVGLANSTFSDPGALAPTVDAQGATNKLANTDVLVRYMPTIHRHWTVGVSVENPTRAIPAIVGETANVSARMPDFAACVQYQWGDGEHVRLAGIYRTLHWRNLIAQCNSMTSGWALQLSSMAHPAPPVTTYITFNYGHGYGGLTNDLLAGHYDLLPTTVPGKLYAPRSLGYCVGVQYNFTPELFVSGSFSQTRMLPKYTLSSEEYRYGWCADINVFWNIIPRLQVAAEFDYGKRANVGGATGYARRIGALCQFSF